MNSIILQIASKYLKVLFIVFAFFALYRGHNEPGGGFIGGLLASLAVIYSGLAFNSDSVYQTIKLKPSGYIAMGLICILLSLLPSVIKSQALMQGNWFSLSFLPGIKLGTPLLFDIGVFFSVVGVTLKFFFTLSMKE